MVPKMFLEGHLTFSLIIHFIEDLLPNRGEGITKMSGLCQKSVPFTGLIFAG